MEIPVPDLKKEYNLKSLLKNEDDPPSKIKKSLTWCGNLEEIHEVESWKQLTAMMHFDGSVEESRSKNKRRLKKEKKRQWRNQEMEQNFKMKNYSVNSNMYNSLKSKNSDSSDEEYEDNENNNSSDNNDIPDLQVKQPKRSGKKNHKKGKNSRKSSQKLKEENEKQEENGEEPDQTQEEDQQKPKQKPKKFKIKKFNSECVKQLNDHENWISVLCNINNEYLITGSDDKQLKFWDLNDDYKLIKSLKFDNDIKSVFFDEYHKILLVGFGNGDLNVLYNKIEEEENEKKQPENTEETDEKKEIKQEKEEIIFKISDFFSKLQIDTSYIISQLHQDQINGIIKINEFNPTESSQNDSKKRKPNKKNKGHSKHHKSEIKSQQQNLQNQLLPIYLSYSLDGEINIFEIQRDQNNLNHKPLFQYQKHPSILQQNSLLFVKDDSFITACQDGQLRLFKTNQKDPIYEYNSELENLQCISRLNSFEERNVKQFAIGAFKQILLFELNNNYKEFTVFMSIDDAHTSYINTLVLLNNDQIFASASHDQTIKIWEFDDENFCVNEKKSISAHSDDILNTICIQDKIFSSSADKTIKIWQ